MSVAARRFEEKWQRLRASVDDHGQRSENASRPRRVVRKWERDVGREYENGEEVVSEEGDR